MWGDRESERGVGQKKCRMFEQLARLGQLRVALRTALAEKKCLPLLPSTCFVAGTADPWFMHDDPRYRVPEPFDHL